MLKSKILMIFLITFSQGVFSKNLSHGINKGSIYLLGTFTGTFDRNLVKSSANNFALSSKIGVGYLLSDNWALALGIPIEYKFLPKMFGNYGIALSFSYLFNQHSLLTPYLGLESTLRHNLFMSSSEFLFSHALDVGILISFLDNAQLDLSLSPEFYYKLSNKQNWRFKMPFGFVGVRVYF